MEIALGIVLVVLSVALTLMVLFQSAKDKRLSGAIAGGAESFLGKDRNSRLDKLLNKLTPIIAGAFAIIVLVMYLIVE